ncbi:hypothetical protein FGO68_gene3713 [Halteria grandinella]|uniref:non-specific serine/threonine protein kinase n=1 Tax=Halteria grandinella TaxID=5974 RepID=A0A8J8NUG1_HALGN|nr:hypothetical protein FGO68_gene3713 [Halteria grandinella]
MQVPSVSFDVINNYRVLRKLGAGTFGTAFQVENNTTSERCVLKYQNDMDSGQMQHRANQDMLREIEFLKSNKHPFIVKQIEAFRDPYQGEHDRKNCIILEYADGGSLEKVLEKNGKAFKEQEALRWFAQICLGLSHLHRKNFVHRDIKLENILIKGIETGRFALISDFGSVKRLTADTLLTVAGTPQYFAPEIFTAEFDHKIDVWAAGIVLYELLTNRDYPFIVSEKLLKVNPLHCLQKAEFKPWPSNISVECRELFMKLFEKDPKRRPSIDEVLQYHQSLV